MKRLRNRQAQKAIYYKKLSLKLNWHNENIRAIFEICSKLTRNTPGQY